MAKQTQQAQQPTGNRLPTGYEGTNIPTDFHIPAVGIADVDTAVFNLFDRDNPVFVSISDEEGNRQYKKKVSVVFATGERFALRQRNNPIRDKEGSLILPIISVRRTGLDQSYEGFGGGYGLAQTTGDLVIKKKLSEKDPEWQNIVNKQGLKEQDNVNSLSNFLNQTTKKGNLPGRFASRRDPGKSDLEKSLTRNDLGSNIFEIITIPFPTFYQAMYEVVIWTSYTQHMNEIVQRIMRGGETKKSYRINTESGYWFVAYFDDDIGSQDNLEEFTDEARVHKTVFTISVPAWMIANQDGGDMVPFRRYLSAPQFSFGMVDGIFEEPFRSPAPSGDLDDFVLDEVKRLDITGGEIRERDTDLFQLQIIKDPFSGEDEEVFVRIKQRNARAGETTISARKLLDVEIP